MIGTIFNEILVRPFLNILVLFYGFIPDFGVSIIILTIIIKVILFPLNRKAIKLQLSMAAIQPKVKEIRQKYKKDFKKQHDELQKLYAEHNIKNPLTGCLPIIVQIPVLLALFRVFSTGLEPAKLAMVYSFISRPEIINPFFIGLFDLSQTNILLAVLAGGAQFIHSRLTLPKKKNNAISKGDIQSLMGRQMLYFLPIMTLFIASALPSALALYWLTSTIFSIVQQLITKQKAMMPI